MRQVGTKHARVFGAVHRWYVFMTGWAKVNGKGRGRGGRAAMIGCDYPGAVLC